MKIKQHKGRRKYVDLSRELKKQWKIKVMVIPSVFGAPGTILKCLGLGLFEIGEQAETIQTAAFLGLPEY